MSTIRERIKQNTKDLFQQEFDLEVFLKYVEDSLTRFRCVDIGIVKAYDFNNTSNYLKEKRQYKGYSTNKAYPTFAERYECYIWRTDCQIPHQFVDNVITELHKQGLRTSQKGACGYDTYDIIAVTM